MQLFADQQLIKTDPKLGMMSWKEHEVDLVNRVHLSGVTAPFLHSRELLQLRRSTRFVTFVKRCYKLLKVLITSFLRSEILISHILACFS